MAKVVEITDFSDPALDVYADTTDDTDTLIFNWSKHSTSNPLTIHGVVDENGNSTAKTLCEASGGKLVFEPIGAVGKITLEDAPKLPKEEKPDAETV